MSIASVSRDALSGLLFTALALVASLIAVVGFAVAEEPPPPGAKTAPVPQVAPGTWWTFRDATSGREVKYEVKKVTKDYVTISVGGRQQEFTHELNATEGRARNGEWGVTYYPDLRFYSFPLWVGKKTEGGVAWTYRGDRGSFMSKSEVVAIEPVVVPAGTFEAFKVTNLAEDRSSECWYAIETRRAVKCEFGTATWELIKYELK